MIKIGNVRFIFYFLAFVLIFFVGRGLIVSASGVAGYYASYLMYPVLGVQNRVVQPITSYFQRRKSIDELTDQLTMLRKQNESLQADLIALKGQVHYFNDIKEVIEFKKRYNPEGAHIGQILLKQFSDQGHFFIINRGSINGIKPDMVAIYDNCLIGKVTDVYPWYCKVATITDKSCKIAAYCEESGVCGIHEGINDLGHTTLKMISHLSTIKEGDLILSQGGGMVFPRGFGLGRIETFEKKGLWYEISVKPLINLDQLSNCLLIHKEAIS